MKKQTEFKMELTAAALKFIRRMMRFSVNAGTGFRLKVRPGGCSGLAVEFDLAAAPADNEIVWDHEELRIFLDSKSCLLLNQSVVDFVDSRTQSGFVVAQPGKTAKSCGSVVNIVPAAMLSHR